MSEMAYRREGRGSMEETLLRLQARLKEAGFGVLATLRVHEILREKIGVTLEPLVILDVCSPVHAQRALSVTREAALLLPCKIVLATEQGRPLIMLQRPTVALNALLPRPDLAELGREVEELLRRAVDDVAEGR